MPRLNANHRVDELTLMWTKAHLHGAVRACCNPRKANAMSLEPKQEPASRPGKLTAAIVAAVVIGVAFLYYWPQIKAAFRLS